MEIDDFETLQEAGEEWQQDEPPVPVKSTPADETRAELLAEVESLRRLVASAEAIRDNAKGRALLLGLTTAFARGANVGAPRRAVVFTESRRTQRYLVELLEQNGYAGQVVALDGANSGPAAAAVYAAWLDRHQEDGQITGSRSVDLRTALVEEFRDRRTILVATEAGAEGLNLQFCSLVVNYDLPWNPQRIEQRIGRCHRYGQTHDVVVLNFLNRRNEADRRVFELLSQKLRLFEGVFGASDEILGALESGIDLERRILDVYQRCRTASEIDEAFDALQRELDDEIRDRMSETRRAVIDHFDEEVQRGVRR